ncbi:YbaB/EbfC family nucleoid-associated protein [Erysipelotrichaceae bacterium Oil+RF-744-GAM-WT-6]|jgi:DNA-binding YbaB/EbfC family protein|uniref:Nucleoid-associated protein FYJ51_07090 n=1 Tax=Stecheria intestinalis TaxID=2606630 RepID=A0A7X2TFF1_9FIRM|nr:MULTISPECIES: YbaB/EbfC family nucleoid-associated protein [Erysipelotrichaceae]MCI2154865.1 YbaB/EbfC family nucleoid-associated protein [Solobacterium sp.]MDY3233170.1 YbaB/EbfC family nucleoid-associated protein [Erysipelotrichaceae bacterium]MDY4682260.1 YbaB/EbfC family nucleoid-associated protein [Lachnospiraceae bacterium]MCI6746928.1 YbaB/EbfC family nucleoid-associated protein [Anaerolactibacter massiliensis]MDD5882170.1 YbaB/EbfC family nucleoid-associated protein [Stecheria intes
MDMQRLMQQAQQMQRKLAKIEEELDATIYEGKNNGVEVKVNGKNEVTEVSIDEDLLDKENKDMLQDMVMLAVNDAQAKAKADREAKMGSVTQGVRMPGM